jgi:hypothetical protein
MKRASQTQGRTPEAMVPDTLDLADRAELALHALTGALDPECDYEIYFYAHFRNPARMIHETTGLPTNNPKFAESLPMMRVMCGSDLNLDIEAAMMKALLSNIAGDGLYYSPARPNRPWHGASEDFANVYGNARVLLAMLAWYQRDQDRAWKRRMKRLVDALRRIAVARDDQAYFPAARVWEAFSYPRSGWKDTNPPPFDHPTMLYHGGEIRALSRYAQVTADEQALELAGGLVRFLRQAPFWQSEAEPASVVGADHAHFRLHFHGAALTLWALLQYAIVTNDSDLKEFVRDGYEYARTFGLPRIGWFPEITDQWNSHCETCCTADMVALAIKLCEAGVGDYWDDVDRYVRNQLVEQQLVRADLLQAVCDSFPPTPVNQPQETADRVIERNLGAFAGHGDPTLLPQTWVMHCCTGNGTQALYYAWHSIIHLRNHTAQVNLLLNRASKWLDVDSYLPYEGKAVVHNKMARRLLVRIPLWVDRRAVRADMDGQSVAPQWAGNYLVIDRLRAHRDVTVQFPMVERTESFTLYDTRYTCRFRGNTVVDISPRRESPHGYPIYLRERYGEPPAPMKPATRYVSPVVTEW